MATMNGIDKSDTGMTALITGASSGIGYQLAVVFARNGHDLVLVARNLEKLRQLADHLRRKFGTAAKLISKDLSVKTSAQEIFDELRQESMSISILVNNAGMDVYGSFHETDMTKELQMIQVNLVSLTQLTKLCLPDMRKQGYGRILNLGSTGSFIPSPLNAVYSATKAYVLSFSEAIGEELQGTGITVTVLCPGATKTEFQKRANMENVRLLKFGVMDAADVAEFGYRAMMAGKTVAVPGLFNKAQVLLVRLLPRSAMTKMAKAMLERSE
jgi:short-subunit dehydrogenase